MKEYLKSQTKTNELVCDLINCDEVTRFSKSDYRWAENKSRSFNKKSIKKGEIYQFEFGKNYVPEMSYEHRGLVIGVRNKLLYVLPIFSYNSKRHKDVFHPIDNPSSKSDLFLLKSTEYPFITHDSVLKLNDVRTVSINRIVYQHKGRIDPSTETYKTIESLSFQKVFPSFYYEYKKMKEI